jgi:hypothetical protein
MSNIDVSVPPNSYLTPEERDSLKRILASPEEFPREFGGWIVDYINLNAQLQPFQVQGLGLREPRTNQVVTSETLGWLNAYSDLATVGPSLDGLGRGTYLVTFGCQLLTGEASVDAYMSISINGATALDADGFSFQSSSLGIKVPLNRSLILDLTNPSNTIVCKYKRIGNGATVATFYARYLNAIRVGNL